MNIKFEAKKIRMSLKISVLFFLIISLVSCDSSSPLLEHFTPSGNYTLTYNNLPEIDKNNKIRLGGFNGLFYKSGRVFYAVTDRGPVLERNHTVSLVNEEYTPEIVELILQDDNSIKIGDRIQLTAPGGNLTSGKIPAERINYGEEFKNQNTDFWGINPSGVYYDQERNFFWFSDLYSPGLFQTTVNGDIVKRLRPDEGVRRAYRSAYSYGGFSGVDYDNEKRLVAVFGGGLNNKAIGDDTSQVDFSIRRIARIDYTKNRKTRPEAEISMFYKVEPESVDGIPAEKISLGDISVVDDTTYIVTEYAQYNGVNRSLLFMVKTTNATKIIESQEGLIGKTYETLLPEEIEKNEIEFIFVQKTLIQDLSTLGINLPTGISLVGKNNLAIIQNNKFGITNGNPDNKTFNIEENDIELKIIDISKIYEED